MNSTRSVRILALSLAALSARTGIAAAQEVKDTTKADTVAVTPFTNTMAGEFSPAKGTTIFTSQRGSLNLSFYGLFRYLNQLPGEQTFTDHLGRERNVAARNDLNWHRTMIWFTGHFWTPKFRYNFTAWTLGSTQQALLFGNLQYQASKGLTIGVGMLPNLTIRSMQGSFPFWAGSDRQMTEEFMRGGFSSGVFVSGQVTPRFYYVASLNTNLSQLGVTATNDSRNLATSAALLWMPTTGEYGPRGGFADFEEHKKVATRFGASAAHVREGRAAADSLNPNETQLRLSDGVYAFDIGALAPGVTIRDLDYDEIAVDAGLKYHGFSFQGEYYTRRLSNFDATGPVPYTQIVDRGLQLQAGYMVIPYKLQVYATTGNVWDEFGRDPHELSGGVSFFPTGTRSWRLNLHLIKIDKSPTGSNFGYYTAGQTGTTISIGTDVIF